MSLTAGTRLGVYLLAEQIGRGGMGEVYRATDTSLSRQVAIKVLPEAFAQDADRLARFEREAKTLAALNHPNIAQIHGLEKSSGITALVMELVEGDDLSERIAKGAIPLDEALPIAKQIAEALEAAHEQALIHRDLKPANVKVRADGVVKVLDFGLAKAMEPPGAMSAMAVSVSQAPTMTTPAMMTGVGMILGTAAYMSPEQARGKTVDKRADIWTFGCVLYEMLTGARAFAGDDVSDVLASVLAREPDWARLPADVPPAVRTLLQSCLVKDPRRRIADISTALFVLDKLGGAANLAAPAVTTSVASAPSSAPRGRLVWMAAFAVAVFVAATLTVPTVRHLRETPPPAPPAIRLSVAPPQNVTFGNGSGTTIPAVSPDGRRVAFVAARAGVPLLWVRSLDALEAQPLPGTDGAIAPFWSPDSRALGFFAAVGTTLKTIDASGGPVRTLGNVPKSRGAAGTWSPDGVIVFGSQSGGLFTVSANGGAPTPLTTPDAAQGDTAHRFPSFLPDGRHFLYVAIPSNTILLGSLDSKETTRLLTADSQAVYVAPGSLLFVRQGTLVAQPFDARRGTLTGEAVPIAEQVLPDVIGAAAFAASSSGVLAYRTGTASVLTQLTWVDRAGRPLGPVGPPGRYRNPELSPDGTRVAVEATDPQGQAQDIWIVELARGVTSRFTFDPGNDMFPAWSPDGTQIMFGSDRGGGVPHLYQKRADGVGAEEPVLKSRIDMAPNSWAPDGRSVVYRTSANGPIKALFIIL